jgi:hypothetical protein
MTFFNSQVFIYKHNKVGVKKKHSLFKTVKYFIYEIIKMFSSQKSFFSKKRVESGIAFFIGQFGMIFFLLVKIKNLTAIDISIWAGIEFGIAGYIISQIQKQKKFYHDLDNESEDPIIDDEELNEEQPVDDESDSVEELNILVKRKKK